MIPEYHLYHGAVLAALVSGVGRPVSICSPEGPRPAEYVVDGRIGLHVKHATQRLRPWHFGFTADNIKAIRSLHARLDDTFLVLVCRQDGIVAVDLTTVISNISTSEGLWIRADREKRKHYRLFGPLGEFARKFDSSILPIKQLLEISPPP